MPRMNKLDVGFNGLMPTLESTLKKWQPKVAMKSEAHFRDELFKHLREITPEDTRIEREYRHQGTTWDIYVAWKGMLFRDEVFFELKRNLTLKTVYNRLVGQIEDMNPS